MAACGFFHRFELTALGLGGPSCGATCWSFMRLDRVLSSRSRLEVMMRRHDFSLPTLVKSWALIHKFSPVATFILTPTRKKKKKNTYSIKDHCNVFVETDKPKGFISRLLLLDYNIDVVRKGLLWCLCLENFFLPKKI